MNQKSILLILFIFLVLTGHLFGQTSQPEQRNNERLSEIAQQLKVAVNHENYKTAAQLQKEERIRTKMAKAFKEEDYQSLAKLKENLENCNCIILPKTKEKPLPSTEKDIAAPLHYLTPPQPFRHNHYVNYFNFIPFSYVKTKSDVLHYDYYNDMTPSTSTHFLVGGGFRYGGTLFFGDDSKDKKIKVGLDFLYITFNAAVDMRDVNFGIIYFGLGRVGINLKGYFNDYSGLNFKSDIGSGFSTSSLSMAGIGLNTTLSYWFKNLYVGLEYHFIGTNNNGYGGKSINQLSVNCGFHF